MGHIIEEIETGETKVCFCDDYYRDRKDDEVRKILNIAASEAASSMNLTQRVRGPQKK